jgi:RNA polymerase sigma-70 factor (ECF subfamily)
MATTFSTSDLHSWFTDDVLPHESDLTRYLRNRWFDRSDILYLRQEVYVRVCESAAKARPNHTRAFLFATARNLMADRVRRERVVSIHYTRNIDSLNRLVDELSPEHRLNAKQELRRTRHALEELSGTSGKAIWLCRVEGLPQKEVAAHLGVPEGTLESQISRGMRVLSEVISGTKRTRESRVNIHAGGSSFRPRSLVAVLPN